MTFPSDSAIRAYETPEGYTERLAFNLPEEIKRLKAFLLWKLVPCKNGGKSKKIPFYANGNIRSGQQGSPEDRVALVSFQKAISAYEKAPDDYAGIGLATSKDLGIIAGDLDDCFDGNIGKWTKPELKSFIAGTYAEISPSDTGIRCFWTGTCGRHQNANGIELFGEGQFVTLTGNCISASNTISAMSEAVRKKLADLFGTKKSGSARGDQMATAFQNDPVYQYLKANDLVIQSHPDGKAWIRCPHSKELTAPDGDGDCAYFLPNTGGYKTGHFKCLHKHCADRSNRDFLLAIHGEMSSYQTQPNFYRYHLNICSLSHVQIKCQMVGPNNTALRH